MPVIAEESGADDLLLRPLCAKNLAPTRPELEGWVDREQLLDFSGRSRKPQMALAAHFGFEDYAQPAGGCCFLTDRSYSVKLQDLWNNRGNKQYELDDIMLLKVGRHIRPSKDFKLIIAREEGETRYLSGYRHQFQTIKTVSHGGPLALVEGAQLDAEQLELACAITARFSQGRDADLGRSAVHRSPAAVTEHSRQTAARRSDRPRMGLAVNTVIEVDARRLLCPMPVIRLQDCINQQSAGTRVRITCTDPGTLHDIPTWCRINGHEVLTTSEQQDELIFVVRKNSDAS